MTKRLLKKGGGIAVNKKQKKPISKLFDLEAKHLSDGSGEDEVDPEEDDDEFDEIDTFTNNNDDEEEASASSTQSVKVLTKPIKRVKAATLKKGSPIVEKLQGDS